MQQYLSIFSSKTSKKRIDRSSAIKDSFSHTHSLPLPNSLTANSIILIHIPKWRVTVQLCLHNHLKIAPASYNAKQIKSNYFNMRFFFLKQGVLICRKQYLAYKYISRKWQMPFKGLDSLMLSSEIPIA